MEFSDRDVDAEVEEAIADARRNVETRREMKSGQVKSTIWGPMRFMLVVDLPADLPEDNFRDYMAEYGQIITEAFKRR